MEKRFFKSKKGIIVLCLSLFAVALVCLRVGSSGMNTAEFFGGLSAKNGYEKYSVIVLSLRLPRILSAMLAGIGLSVSGVLLQGVTGNELAAPNIIGVNAGAGFAVIMMLLVFPNAVFATPFMAFIGAFLTTLVIVAVASRVDKSKSAVILSGIAVTAMLNAGISFISLLDPDLLVSYNYFSVGALSGIDMKRLIVPSVIIIICLLVSGLLSGKIDALCLGDSVALSLGINVKVLRTVCLVLASASAAAVVSFAGMLGFVGLVVPHIARKLTGSASIKSVLPVSALSGSILVLLADLFGRVVFAPSELPVGIVMAFIGSPFFFWLLIRRRKNA